jgi:FkbM family methyltransferase
MRNSGRVISRPDTSGSGCSAGSGALMKRSRSTKGCDMRCGLPMFKKYVKKTINSIGFDIREYHIDKSESARMRRFLSHHGIDLVLDVGANAGQFGRHLREIDYLGKIVSFEPLSEAYARLLAERGKDPLWLIAPRAAIGAESGEVVLNVSANSQSSSVLPMLDAHVAAAPDSRNISVETVPLRKLDDIAKAYVEAAAAAYLKIDVQGYEAQVLEGARGILPKIKGIQTELSLTPFYQGQTLYRGMIDAIVNLGFELHAIFPVFSDEKSGRMLQVDGVFFRSGERATASAEGRL